jgi:hypothetical protein
MNKDLLGVLILLATAGAISWLTYLFVAQIRRRRRILREGVPTVAAIVQANTELFAPGIDQPAQVVFSLDKGLADPLPYLRQLAQRMFALKNTRQADADLRLVAGVVTRERYRPLMCVQLPVSFTGGPAVYTAHVMVRRRYLHRGFLTEPCVVCKAIAGPQGGVVMIPSEQAT